MGTLLILVLLAVVWAGVGIHWLRTRRPLESMSFAGVGRGVPSPRSTRAPVVPLRGPVGVRGNPSTGRPATRPGVAPVQTYATRGVSSAQARQRRRMVILGLAGLAFLTLLGAFAGGGAWVALHLLVDVALLTAVVAVVQYQREVEARRLQVRPLRQPMSRQPAMPAGRLAATGTDARAVRSR